MQIDETAKRGFGKYLKERRLSLGLTNKEVSSKLNISPSYLVDIEKGNRAAPLKHLTQLEDILLISEDEKNEFYDLAYQTHGNHLDINEYLDSHPTARKAVRLARDKNMSGEEFLDIVLSLTKENIEEEEIEK